MNVSGLAIHRVGFVSTWATSCKETPRRQQQHTLALIGLDWECGLLYLV